MNMGTNAFFNRIEIIFYSTLIACLSGMKSIRTNLDQLLYPPYPHSDDENVIPYQFTQVFSERLIINSRIYLRRVILPLLTWMTLGFAAGFLIGMIKFR